MDGGAWLATVHGVMKSQTRLSDFTFTFHFHALEKEMVTHSSVLAWRIPGMAEPGGSHLQDHTESDPAEATQQQQQRGIQSNRHEILTKKMIYAGLPGGSVVKNWFDP